MSLRSRREPSAFLPGALLLCLLGATGASCQTEELRLFDPLLAGAPDASLAAPRDVVPRTIAERDSGPAPTPPDAGTANAAPTPARDLQPACEANSAACRTCVATQRCVAPDVCHPSSGDCVAACPEGSSSECTAAGGPLCDPSYRVCVWCLSDANCGGATPACDSAAGVCVECLTDRHCALAGNANLPHCNTAAQSCRGCVVDADCGPGLHCEASEGHCDDSGGSGDDSGGSGDDSGGSGDD